jgi:hypothetical protein
MDESRFFEPFKAMCRAFRNHDRKSMGSPEILRFVYSVSSNKLQFINKSNILTCCYHIWSLLTWFSLTVWCLQQAELCLYLKSIVFWDVMPSNWQKWHDVFEKHTASIFRVQNISELHSVPSQKILLFIAATMTASNLVCLILSCMCRTIIHF